MKLVIIRHGESEADLLGVHEGRANFSLTQRGHEQAEAMALWVCKHHMPQRLYCSTLTRARQTAAHLAAHTGLVPIFDDDLMEFQNGLIAGLSRHEAMEKYPPVSSLPLHEAVYGQETQLDFRMRAERALSRILCENEADATVAVVSHGGLINKLYHAFLQQPIASTFFFAIGHAAVHVWQVTGDKRMVHMSNFSAYGADI